MSVSAGFPGTRNMFCRSKASTTWRWRVRPLRSQLPITCPTTSPINSSGSPGACPVPLSTKLVYDQYGDDPGLVKAKATATQALNVLNMGHLFIVLLILLGNVAFFLTRNIEEA